MQYIPYVLIYLSPIGLSVPSLGNTVVNRSGNSAIKIDSPRNAIDVVIKYAILFLKADSEFLRYMIKCI